MEILLGSGSSKIVFIAANGDVKLPSRTPIISEGRMAIEEKGTYKVFPSGTYRSGEEEIKLYGAAGGGSETLPILITNTGNKTIRIPRVEELGYKRVKTTGRIVSTRRRAKVKEEELIALGGYLNRVAHLLRAIRDVLTNSDKELVQKPTMKMKLNTGDYSPIKLRPYWIPIHKSFGGRSCKGHVGSRDDRAILISFEIVIVEKKYGGYEMQ